MDPEMMKKMAVALGLPETATAEEIMAKIGAMKQAALGTEADGVCAANKDRIGDPVKFKELYVANKDFALKALETMPKPTVCNKADGKKPDDPTVVALNKDTERRAAIETIRTERKCSYVDAEAAAQVRNPELFA